MKDLKNYIETNKDRFLEELFSLIRIPSISSQEEHKPDMIRCAERWRELILAAGADRCEVMPTAGNPVVYGEKIISKTAPTVMVYGHYDVMSVDPLELWRQARFPTADAGNGIRRAPGRCAAPPLPLRGGVRGGVCNCL